MRRLLALLLLLPGYAFAQSSPGLVFNQVPSAGQWNGYFSSKLDANGGTAVNLTATGGNLSGAFVTSNNVTQTLAAWVGASVGNVSGSLVTATGIAGPVTNSLAVWMSYLTGIANPNAVILDGQISGAGIVSLLAPYAKIAAPTFTGAVTMTGTLQAGATTIVTPSSGGLGTLTVGAGGSNHVVLTATTSGTGALVQNSGTGGLKITSSTAGGVVLTNANVGNGQIITWAGSSATSAALAPFTVSNGWVGDATSAPSSPILNRISVESDNIINPSGFPVTGLYVSDRYGGNVMTGSRFAMTVQGNQGVATNDASAGTDPNYVALNEWQTANFNVGGTDTTIAGSRGHIFGSNPQAVLTSGATFFNHIAGSEININSAPNVAIRSGLTIASVSGSGKGQEVDAMLWTYGEGAKWTNGWLIGGPTSAWPFDTNSTIIGATTGAASVPQQAKWGVDLNEVSLTASGNIYDGGFLRAGGFSVDGAGTTRIGTTLFTPSATGLVIDAVASVGTTANGAGAIASGGTGYTTGTNTDIARDALGGLYRLTVAAGVVTSITVLAQPVYPSHTTPSNPIATTTLGTVSGQGSGLTLNLSWNTTGTTVSLNPSGGAILAAGLPTSAPGTHCALWVNSGVVTRTTCP